MVELAKTFEYRILVDKQIKNKKEGRVLNKKLKISSSSNREVITGIQNAATIC